MGDYNGAEMTMMTQGKCEINRQKKNMESENGGEREWG